MPEPMPTPMDELHLNEMAVADYSTPPHLVRSLAAEHLWLRAAVVEWAKLRTPENYKRLTDYADAVAKVEKHNAPA